MKHTLILLSAFVLAQSLTVEESDLFGKDAEELLVPLLKEFAELKHLVDEVKQYQKTQKISPLAFGERIHDTPFIEAWDADACKKMTETLTQAVNLADNITNWVFNAGVTIGEKILHLIHCALESHDEGFQCAMYDINDIRVTIDSYRPLVKQFKADIYSLSVELRDELKKCLSIKKNA